MGYYTNSETRKRIDSLLEINARIQANLGTKSTYDIGSVRIADQMWVQFLVEIHGLDKEYYRQIATNEEKEMVSKKIYNKHRYRLERDGGV